MKMPSTTTIYIVGGIVAVVLALYFIRSIVYAFKGNPEDEKKANAGKKNAAVNSIDDTIKLTEKAGNKTKLSKIKLKSIADAIYNSFNGAGTNEDVFINFLKTVPSELDLAYVIKYFGLRDGMDLSAWVEDEGLTNEANEELKRRGVKFYQF